MIFNLNAHKVANKHLKADNDRLREALISAGEREAELKLLSELKEQTLAKDGG